VATQNQKNKVWKVKATHFLHDWQVGNTKGFWSVSKIQYDGSKKN